MVHDNAHRRSVITTQWSTTLKLTPRLEVEFDVAVRPPVLPETLLLSTSTPDMCPDPESESVLRSVWLPGVVQPLVPLDSSAQ